MRLVIDLQTCQGSSRLRGIGRYSLSLAKAMAGQARLHEVWLLLNQLTPGSEETIREQFEGLLPREHIVVCHLPSGQDSDTLTHTWLVRAEERIRQVFLEQLHPDVVHIASLFEDVHAHSHIDADSPFPSAVTLFDLIPLLRPASYLAEPRRKAWYERKIESLLRAQLLLAISAHTRQEAIAALHLPESRVVNISSAADPHFRPVTYAADCTAVLLQKYGLTRPFIMYTGGIDARKNIQGLLRAYAALPESLRRRHQLAIVCAVKPQQKTNLEHAAAGLGLRPGEVVFTGYVAEEDLVALYNLCALFVFPSLHEGFGLPILEAMACGAPVIGADASSLPEVIGRADALFDPLRPDSIMEKMRQALTDESFRQSLREYAPIQAAKFSWAESARRAWAALEDLHDRQKPTRPTQVTVHGTRPTLAFVSPLPPEKTGIADYSAVLLPALAEHYDIDLIVNQAAVAHPVLDGRFRVRSLEWFGQNAHTFERILYQFGNSPFHYPMFDLLRAHPGTVVLHDFYLGRVIQWMEDNQGRTGYFARQLCYSHGEEAPAFAKEYRTGEPAEDYPCNKAVLDQAAGLIVHSAQARTLAQNWYGAEITEEFSIIPQLNTMPAAADHVASRAKLGLAATDFVVACFGFISPSKDNLRLLSAWLSSALTKDQSCRLVFVGENHAGKYGQKILEAIKRANLGDRIRLTGYTSADDFAAWLAAADVAVQLRRASRGETSSCVLNCLAQGLPLIVNAQGSMAELPHDAVWMLPENYEASQLVNALETLRADAGRRAHLGAAAQTHMRKNHSPTEVARQYREAIERAVASSRQAAYRRLIRQVAAIDGNPDEADLIAVAASIAANHPHRGVCRAAEDAEG